jgi:hypothetical protein
MYIYTYIHIYRPVIPSAHVALGDCYEMTGQTDLAIEAFKEAIKVYKHEVQLKQLKIAFKEAPPGILLPDSQGWSFWIDLLQAQLRAGKPLSEVRATIVSYHAFAAQEQRPMWQASADSVRAALLKVEGRRKGGKGGKGARSGGKGGKRGSDLGKERKERDKRKGKEKKKGRGGGVKVEGQQELERRAGGGIDVGGGAIFMAPGPRVEVSDGVFIGNQPIAPGTRLEISGTGQPRIDVSSPGGGSKTKEGEHALLEEEKAVKKDEQGRMQGEKGDRKGAKSLREDAERSRIQGEKEDMKGAEGLEEDAKGRGERKFATVQTSSGLKMIQEFEDSPNDAKKTKRETEGETKGGADTDNPRVTSPPPSPQTSSPQPSSPKGGSDGGREEQQGGGRVRR